MNEINCILVPTDFSGYSQYANEFAIEMAKESRADLIFFHAFHIPVNDPISPVYSSTGPVNPGRELMIEHEKTINEQLKALCNEVNTRFSGSKLRCSAISKAGFLVDQIIDTCEEQQVDLIIMGTQGATGLKEALLGSNTANVIQKAKCPVLAIPKGTSFYSIEKVVYATDFDDSQIENIRKLSQYISLMEGHIHVVHIEQAKNDHSEMELFQKKVVENLSYGKISFHSFQNEDIVEGVDEAIISLGADMLSMARKSKGFFHNLFSKDITAKMAYHTKLPLLVFHQET